MRMIGALLRSGRLSEFQALGAVGTPVYSAAEQLLVAIRRQLGPEVTELFAVPKQNDRGDAIDWYAPMAGEVVPWSAASPEERTQAKAAMLAAREHLLERSRALQGDVDRERQVFGKLLEQATQIPSGDHVYLVNSKPVITFWGFNRRGVPLGFDVLGELETGWPVPARAQDTQSPSKPVPPLANDPTPNNGQRVVRTWTWWLWWLLPLLLLLALLALGLRSCGVPVPLVLSLKGTLPTAEPPAAPLPPSATTSVIEQGPHRVTEGVGRNRVERSSLIETVGDTAVSGTLANRTGVGTTQPVEGSPPGEKMPVQPEGAVVPPSAEQKGEGANKALGRGDETRAEDPTAQADLNQDKSLEPPPNQRAVDQPTDKSDDKPGDKPLEKHGDQAPDKPADKPPDTPGDKTADKPGDKQADKPVAPKPPPPFPDGTRKTVGGKAQPAGPPLTIPPDALKSGTTAFLNGQWRSTTGLQDTDGNPVQLHYDFKQDAGTATLVRGAGTTEQRCTGSVKPVMRDGKLVIEETSSIVCPDGTQFRRSNVECSVGEQGQAKCRGLNDDGSAYNVSITGQ